MAVNGVISTLPDPKWVAAVEKELEELRAENATLRSQLTNQSRR